MRATLESINDASAGIGASIGCAPRTINNRYQAQVTTMPTKNSTPPRRRMT